MVLVAKITIESSYRSLSKVFVTVNLYFNLEFSAPTFSTVKLWVKKIGYYQLQSVKEKADDWIIILDESIGIGQEKLLVVLGIRQRNVDFSRPLKLQDMEPITVKSSEKWTGEDIAKELEIVKTKLGSVKYAVTDAGANLKKGLNISGITHMYDITHALAIYLERIYGHDSDFIDFVHQAGQMRAKLCCGKSAHLIPPNQRSKSRFLNIDIMSKWAMMALAALEKNNLTLSDEDELKWLKKYKPFLEEMSILISVIEKISVLLKNEGFSVKTKAKCKAFLKVCKKNRLAQFKEYMMGYLKEYEKKINRKTKKLICTSDIIESTFGRFKNEISKNAMSGITDLALVIAAFTVDLTIEKVNAAIDSCNVKVIEDWRKENLCSSLLSKRKAVFGSKRGELNFS